MLYTVYLPILLQQLDERRILVRYKCICRDVSHIFRFDCLINFN